MRKYLRHSYKRWLLGSCFVFTVVVSAKYEQYRLEIADMQDIPVMAAYNKGVERIDENILPGKIGIQEINQNIKPVNVSKKKESERAIKSYTKTEKYCVPCEYVYDEEMLEGNVETVQDAKEGIKEVTVLASYLNNEEIESVPIETEIVEEAVPMVVHIGTKKQEQFIIPVEGYVFTSPFGPRWGTNHNGVDLAVSEGTSIMASSAGTVIQEGWNGGYGISVYIDHGNGYYTRYGHMSETCVYVGQYVEQGEIIGFSGNTGNSTGPHVHFEIRANGDPLDPQEFVNID